MRFRRSVFIAVALAVMAAACSDTTGDSTSTTGESAATSQPPTTQAEATTTTEGTPEPLLLPRVEITGPEEVVWDWSEQQCEPENIPDIAARAFRDGDGQVQMILGHYVNYRMIGPSFDELVTDCSGPILRSDFDPDHTRFDDSEWIGSPYTVDGVTVYAVVHNEYRGDTHEADRPDQCPSHERLTCLDTSLTMVVSNDGGASYQHIAPPPDHMIATLPYVYDDEGVPSGLRQPSNIIEGPDGYYYVFSNVSDYPNEAQWVCAMRTDDLSDPDSWRFWKGSDFSGVFVDPYVEDVDVLTPKCAALAREQLGGGVQESIVYDVALGRYVMFGGSELMGAEFTWGVHFATSEDLINWTGRELLIELPGTYSVADSTSDLFYAYPSVIDPDSESMNFETSDGEAYLYLTRLNEGAYSLDRDLVRFPIKLGWVEAEIPDWQFETDGDTEGWRELFSVDPLSVSDGSLLVQTTGDDPYIGSGSITVPDEHGTLVIRMRVSGDGETDLGQVFFGTDTNPSHTEERSVDFEVIADGEFHDYELAMGDVPGWEGIITSLRLDPILDGVRTIEIDRISFR
jgi:hypothetical protein